MFIVNRRYPQGYNFGLNLLIFNSCDELLIKAALLLSTVESCDEQRVSVGSKLSMVVMLLMSFDGDGCSERM